jgi:hypothetical protein
MNVKTWMPWCNICISFPEVGRIGQNMQETISFGCVRKLVYFLGYINSLNWWYTKKYILQFGVGVPHKILYSRRDCKVTDTHTSGLKIFCLSDSHSLLSGASLFCWFFPNFMMYLSEIQYVKFRNRFVELMRVERKLIKWKLYFT